MIGDESFNMVNRFLPIGIDRQGFLDDQVGILEGSFAQGKSVELIAVQFVLHLKGLFRLDHFEGDLLDFLHIITFRNERATPRLHWSSSGLSP